MLKRLELVGFKSFADRTAFDFAPGVTGIVGPNGSGKSNVVDAVRWVLGEQSAKSLRGGEMTDVIFNGSASRKSLGLAEVSMTFDNSKKVLASDAVEVRVTRRVYRSGEGEYLINNQPCRLKDIKDLFLGSGAGTDAYCIIQQGQVDILLQTAPKERRTIFEEAAGISRFKAKKIESLRKLDRVDADLQRLRDILTEIEKQLRSVRLQASKAQKYQEHHTRLRQLKLDSSVREYHRIELQLATETVELAQLKADLEAETARADEGARELARFEQNLAQLDASLREQEGVLGQTRQAIASEQARQAHERATHEQLQQEQTQTRQRLASLTLKLAALASTCEHSRSELLAVETQCQQQKLLVAESESGLSELDDRFASNREESDTLKSSQFELRRNVGHLHNESISLRSQLDTLTRDQNRLQQRTSQFATEVASLDAELGQLTGAAEGLQERMTRSRHNEAELRAQRDRLLLARDESALRISELRAARSGLISRIEVLENLERNREGMSAGVREVAEHLAQKGGWGAVAGMVADLVRVRSNYAPLIDLALGDRSQRFVVLDAAKLAQSLRERGRPFTGRVSFLFLDSAPVRVRLLGEQSTTAVSREAGVFTMQGAHPGIVKPAEELVSCDAFPELPARLLSNTVIVHDLMAAHAIVALGAGLRCITLAGEILEPDGTLTVGTHHAEAGILSRKSELRELREQVADFDGRLAAFDEDLAAIKEQLATLDAREQQAARGTLALSEQLTDLRFRITQRQEKRDGLSEEMTISASELGTMEQDIEQLRTRWQQVEDQALAGDEAANAAENRIAELDRESREIETRRSALQQHSTDGRVALAQIEERLAGLAQRQKRLEAERDEHIAEHERTSRRLEWLGERQAECARNLLRSTSLLADTFWRKEAAEHSLRRCGAERADIQRRRRELSELTQSSRSAWRERQEAAHQKEMSVNTLNHSRDVICLGLKEDYQIDLEPLYRKCLEGEPDWFTREPEPALVDGTMMSPQQEITERKKQLSKLGSVNMESIAELAELESRHSALKANYDDLHEAQRVLLDIISRINTDSRRMFQETFEAIRLHFQELFRKLFGGGRADIVLEEGVDILESGIEIVAQPPGKELRGISLMSGGEKTMAAVALLMAIFQSKPSPFCILDEVDAALDEGNVGRFTAVLREFLSLSQFIIITHRMRTMSAADVLWGVTMAEAGVSSKYAVRYEDYPQETQKAA